MASSSSTKDPGALQTDSVSNKTESLSLEGYLKGLMQLQHRSIDQANADRAAALEMRQADADRIA
jgi:hypothetical protein